jgi:hypothetical protein
MDLAWYLRRLRSMSATEVAHRTVDAGRRQLWARRPPEPPERLRSQGDRPGPITPDGLVDGVTAADRVAVKAAADDLLEGRWPQFGRVRHDMTADVDWFLDFVNHRRAPDTAFSLGIDHRDEAAVGNIKFVWEAARHQHLTVLAVAYATTGDEVYARRIDTELRRFWSQNPFLVGIHWTSGIELGIRLLSWVWIRRLLAGWDGAADLFEDNPDFVEQLGRHHQWIHGLGSHGSSANNHLIAEAAGQFVAATAFPLFAESALWREAAAEELGRELEAQTFGDGLNKELASDYHGFVLELALAPWVEARLSGHWLADALAQPLAAPSTHCMPLSTGGAFRIARPTATTPTASCSTRSAITAGRRCFVQRNWWRSRPPGGSTPTLCSVPARPAAMFAPPCWPTRWLPPLRGAR